MKIVLFLQNPNTIIKGNYHPGIPREDTAKV